MTTSGAGEATTTSLGFWLSSNIRKDRPVFAGDESYLYKHLWEEAQHQANILGARVNSGDVGLLAMSRTQESIVNLLACFIAGVVAVPVSSGAESALVGEIVSDVAPKVRLGDFCSAGLGAASVPTPGDLAVTGCNHRRPISPHEVALVLYTSGTTAKPKGVMLSHRNIIANTESVITCINVKCDDIVGIAPPLHYSYGLSMLYLCLRTGARIAQYREIVFGSAFAEEVRDTSTTLIAGVPFHYETLYTKGVPFDEGTLPHLRAALVAGGAMPFDMVHEFQHRFAKCELYLMYGQTEATARLSCLPPEQAWYRPRSIGRGIPGVKLSVLDSMGDEIQVGEVGEIYAAGENIMLGYYNDEQATAEVLTRHGLRTGDLATIDDEGYVYIVGRRADFAKIRGVRISLTQVEEICEGWPGVVEALAIVEIRDGGIEEIAVRVCIASGIEPGAWLAEAGRFLRQVPFEKRPTRVSIVPEIPRTASGKKLRRISDLECLTTLDVSDGRYPRLT
jgi:long-chain acyl-CoA synthetase